MDNWQVNLALDFANTESGRGFSSHQNHFREAGNVVEWLGHAKALPADEADWLRARSLQLDLTPLTLQQLVVQAAARPADALERTSA